MECFERSRETRRDWYAIIVWMLRPTANMSNITGKGGFNKGFVPWNKGTKGLMGSKIGRPKGYPSWNKGMKGIYSVKHNGQFKKGQPPFNKGTIHLSKENHPNWISDRTKLVKSEKKHLDGRYREWMFAVKKRDNYKCKINNSDCRGRLESHHILNWKDYPELRYELKNGITLCHAHHPRGRNKEAELSPFFQRIVAEMK